MKVPENITELFEFFYIGKPFKGEFRELYFKGMKKKPPAKYRLDIIAAQRLLKTENVFHQIHRNNLKISATYTDGLVFICAAEEKLEFQLIEAVLEEFVNIFKKYMKEQKEKFEKDYFGTFDTEYVNLGELIANVKKYVASILVYCPGCNDTIKVYIKKSFIEKNRDRNFPIPFVYVHKGHALLIYVDEQFKVRGTELVEISY